MNNFHINVSSFSISKPPSDINHRRHFEFTQFRVEKQIYRQSTFHSGKIAEFRFLPWLWKLPSNKKISRLFGSVCSGESTLGTGITLKAKTSRSRNLTFATPFTKPLKNQLNRSISSRRRLSFELKKRETVLYPCLSTYRLSVMPRIASHENERRRRLTRGIWSR